MPRLGLLGHSTIIGCHAHEEELMWQPGSTDAALKIEDLERGVEPVLEATGSMSSQVPAVAEAATDVDVPHSSCSSPCAAVHHSTETSNSASCGSVDSAAPRLDDVVLYPDSGKCFTRPRTHSDGSHSSDGGGSKESSASRPVCIDKHIILHKRRAFADCLEGTESASTFSGPDGSQAHDAFSDVESMGYLEI